MLKIKYIFIMVLILHFPQNKTKKYLQYTIMIGKYMMCTEHLYN